MLDSRIYTFLELCNTMNYHRTAENLNMTQPAVTQHIKFLEESYNCKLFDYSNRKLLKTKNCMELEKFARTIISLNMSAKEEMTHSNKVLINIGATKTIGDYKLDSALRLLLSKNDYEVNIVIDNTKNLIDKLNHFELDLLLLEGYVDKDKYEYQKISTEEIVGICAIDHPFAFEEIAVRELFEHKIVLREKGSGTRNVLENFLQKQGYSVDSFKDKSSISSNKLIECAVENGLAISFVYDIISKKNKNLATFRIKESKILHEFNFVFLSKSKAGKIIPLLSL